MCRISLIIFLFIFQSSLLLAQSPVNDKTMNEFYGFKVIQDEATYTNKAGEFIFYAEQEYIDFCNATFGLDSKIPFVDFNQETAIIVFKKVPNGSNLFIDSAVETEKFIRISAKTTAPLEKSTKAFKNRYLIVKVKKSNKEIMVVYL